MTQSLKRTQLYDWHQTQGAKLVPFAGWEMPVQYPTGPIEEHHITRRSAGLFDIDHMGQFIVNGPDAAAYLNYLVTSDLSAIGVNQSKYGLMCYEHGGIVDDVFIYRLSDRWMVVVNADNLTKDYQWMERHIGSYDVTLQDVSDEMYMVALQGPKAIDLLQHLTDLDISTMPRFSALEGLVNGIQTIVGRTGYTGEDGVELFFPATQAVKLWTDILAKGDEIGLEVKPIGLAARDSLRFEPGFSLYGHEITADITPLEASLSWACHFDTDFVGREALLKQKEAGLSKRLIAFELSDKGVPRQGYTVTSTEGQELGPVVTGLYAPTVDKYCGHAFVPLDYAKSGTPLNIIIRNKPKAAVVVKRPLYRPSYQK